MQWNMLACALCDPNPHSSTPKQTYNWYEYRLWRTIEEMIRYDADIICVEEIDAYEQIKPYLHYLG